MKHRFTFFMFKILIVTCFYFVLATPLFSIENVASQPLNLQSLFDIALQNNPTTKAAWWNARRAADALGSSKSAYYPNIAFNANITNGRDFKFRNGPDVNYTTVAAEMILTFLVADFGERAANTQAFMHALEAAGWESEAAIQKVMAEVLENGYSLIYAQEILQALLVSLEDANKMVEAASKLQSAGLNPISDVYTSKASLSQIQMQVAQQKSTVDIQRAKLATTLGYDADTFLEVAPLEAVNVPEMKIGELLELAKNTRQDLMAKRARLCESIAKKRKVDASYLPKLAFASRGGVEHAVHDKANGAHYQIALNLDVPLFTGFEATYASRQAYADIKITAEELAQLELAIALDVLAQSRTVGASGEMLQYAKENLKHAHDAYNATLRKYQAGRDRIAELSIALQQYVSARVRHSEVSSQYLVAIANLAYSTGTLGACAR
ncbi:MAG: TolC family protein [Parachlamydiaceae bacterium]